MKKVEGVYRIKYEREKNMAIDGLKKEIIFSDYDGTIFITEQSMKKNVRLIAEYRNLGGKFVIVSGRSKMSAKGVIEKYNIPFDYLISHNGAVVFDKDETKIAEERINKDVANKIIEHLRSRKNIEIYFYDDEDKIEYYGQSLLKIRAVSYDYELAQDIEDEINNNFGEYVKAHSAFPGMYYDNRNFVIVDIVSIKAGKEEAIKKIVEMLNIEKNQVATIGDGRNDIGMIKEYNGYSLRTAENAVKEIASKIFENISDMVEYLKIKNLK